MAFFGCGSPKEDGKEEEAGPPEGTADFEKTVLTLPAPTEKPTAETGEKASQMFKFVGDDFTKISDARPGSFLEITYKENKNQGYACGEIGWVDKTKAGPVISGKEKTDKPKNQTVYIFREDLVLGTDNFTIHIFNSATLIDVTLNSAPPTYTPTPNPKATPGAKKIVVPPGCLLPGKGDLSKVDFTTITTAADSGTLVFYFDVVESHKNDGLLKFGPKSGDPYYHYGISKEGVVVTGNDGWCPADADGKVIYKISDIKTAITEAKKIASDGDFNKLEINFGATDEEKKADLLYIELIP